MKTLKISDELHQQLKVEAANSGMTIQEIVSSSLGVSKMVDRTVLPKAPAPLRTQNFCKAGHPTNREDGKCLVKGCKYVA